MYSGLGKHYEIDSEETVFKRGPFKIVNATLRHKKTDGTMSETIQRMNFERGDSVAVLIYNASTDTFTFVNQFRYPTCAKNSGWVLELPAGKIDADETPEEAAIRETVEETGITPDVVHKVCTFYVSPGGTSERIHLYYSKISNNNDSSLTVGGLKTENEDIEIVRMSTYSAKTLLEHGLIIDAKTIIALQWFFFVE